MSESGVEAVNANSSIGIVIRSLEVGGAESMVRNLACALKARSRNVAVFSLLDLRTPLALEIESEGIPVVYLGKRPGFDSSLAGNLAATFEKHKIDVIHTHLPILKYVVPATRRMNRTVRLVHTFHSVADRETASRLIRMQNRMFFKALEIVPVALSQEVQQSITDVYSIPTGKIPIVHNGVDLERFSAVKPLPSDQLRLLHVGRFREVKNHHFLLDVYERLKPDHPNISLTMVGDGPLMGELFKRVEAEQIADVCFAGEQDDVSTFYAAADVFLLPSLYEGVPMSIIEAMASGLPIVASNVGGVPMLVRNGENGYVAELEVAAFASRVDLLLASGDLRRDFGKRSHELVKRFSSDAMADEYEHLYFD